MALSVGEAFPFERSALALAGSKCRQSEPAIVHALERLDGVTRVEGGLIPDHILIDHDGRRVTGDQLAGIVNAVPELRGICRAAVMRSCITAGRHDTGGGYGR
jgi:hypothetical protein